MVYGSDPGLSTRPSSGNHTPWELTTLVIGLLAILTGAYLIITAPSSSPTAGFQHSRATQNSEATQN